MDIVAGINGKKNQLFINTLGKYSSARFSNNLITYGIALSDVNGDGRLDIIEANSGTINNIFFNKK